MSLDRPIVETAYLTAPNVGRYRRILRFFYQQHQRLTYWLTAEDVAAQLRLEPEYAGYTLDECQQDLNGLVEWKNLLAVQDAGRVQTIEEFKNRRFRYQLTPYTIEIERLTVRLESIAGVGGSLEANLFERIAQRLEQLPEQPGKSASVVHSWWQDVSTDFQRLNDNATDYIGSLQGSQLDQMANTAAFLLYKETIVEYLRSFIRELQRCGPWIGSLLHSVPAGDAQDIVDKVAQHEAQIPRMGEALDAEDLRRELAGQWSSLQTWFLGSDGKESEAERLLAITNTIIRRITRYANRLAETQNRAVSRHREYIHLAQLFADCHTVQEAHRLAAAVFGAVNVKHLRGEFLRATDSIHSSVFAEAPFVQEIRPKVRTFSERAVVEGITDKQRQKDEAIAEYLRLQQEERLVMQRYIQGETIDFGQLPVVEPFVRNTLLRWLGRATASPRRQGKTEDGRSFVIAIGSGPEITLRCTDGHLAMPPVILTFVR